MAKVVGIVNLYSDVDFKGLTERRPVASVSFLGRYALIDFALSNMSNSKIDRVGVLIQKKPRSLFKHLGSGDSWDFNSKSGGVSLLYDERHANGSRYSHDLNNIEENIDFFEQEDPDYVVIAPSHIINIMDYSDVVNAHINSGADITVVYQNIKDGNESFIGGSVLDVKDGYVVGSKINKGSRKNVSVSLETYVINTKELYRILNVAKKVSSFFDLKDAIRYILDEKQVHAYQFRGYTRCIDSLEAYYKYSIELLNQEVSSAVFKSNWPIYTKTNDTPPTKYLKNADVRKAFVANGSVIDGYVENSIIGRDVVVGQGAVIKNSIIFSGAEVAPGAYLENVIMDKRSKVVRANELIGDIEEPLYIREGDVV